MSTTRRLIRATAAVGTLAIAGGLLGSTTTTAHADAWVPGVQGVTPLGNLPSGAKIAVEPDGDATAVWNVDVEGNQVVMSASHEAGTPWTAPSHLSDPASDAFGAEVRVNADGDAVVWWRVIDDGVVKLQVTRRLDGQWSTSFPAGEVAVIDGAADIDADGNVFGAYGYHTAVRSFTWPVGGFPAGDLLSLEQPYDVDVAVTPAGKATVIWTEDGPDALADVRATTFDQGGPLPAKTVDVESVVGQIDLEVNDAGVAQAAYSVANGGQGIFVTGVRGTGNNWEFPDTVSFNGDNSLTPTVGIDAKGNAAIAWNTQDGEVQVASRGPAGEFGTPQTLFGQGLAIQGKLVMNAAGDTAVQWRTNEPGIRLAMRKRGAASFGPVLPMTGAPFTSDNRDLGMDDQGSITATYGVKLSPTTGRVLARTYDVGGPKATMSKPAGPRANSTSIPLAWSAEDRYGPVEGKVVQVRAAAWNGGFGAAKDVNSDLTLSAMTFAGQPGRSYCFTSYAFDHLGNSGANSSYRCTTTPVDDRTPTLTGAWQNAKGTAHYRGTVRVTTKKGATLKLTDVKVRRLGLLVAKGKGHGSVAVYFNGVKLGTYSLAAATSKVKQQVHVRDFGTLRTGTVMIKVVSATGKPVKIDGLHVQRLL